MPMGSNEKINDLVRTRGVPEGRIVDQDGENGEDQKAKQTLLVHYFPIFLSMDSALINLAGNISFTGNLALPLLI